MATHSIVDGVEGKVCSRCREWKPLTSYYKGRRLRDGLISQCKTCSIRESQAYNAVHSEERRAYKKQWRLDRVEECRAYGVNWQAEHSENHRLASKRWRESHQEHCAVYRAQYHRTHLHLRAEHGARRRTVERSAFGIDYTTAEMIAARWEVFGSRCWVCGAPATATDHVKPLSKGGAHLPCNLRPICTHCNSSKGAKWPYEKPGQAGGAASRIRQGDSASGD